jgi:hypothetical protein
MTASWSNPMISWRGREWLLWVESGHQLRRDQSRFDAPREARAPCRLCGCPGQTVHARQYSTWNPRSSTREMCPFGNPLRNAPSKAAGIRHRDDAVLAIRLTFGFRMGHWYDPSKYCTAHRDLQNRDIHDRSRRGLAGTGESNRPSPSWQGRDGKGVGTTSRRDAPRRGH